MKRTLLAGMIALTMGAAVAGPWVKYGDEPVLGDTRLGTCFDINVVTNGPAPYTMYFSWRPRKSIALVRSNDALTWTQEPEFCLRENPASGWEDIVNRCCVVKIGRSTRGASAMRVRRTASTLSACGKTPSWWPPSHTSCPR